MLKSIWKYRHLADPTATIRYTGKSESAPSGKWALSDDPKTNLALWNALGVAAVAVPTTAAATILANKYWDKWLDKKVTERSLSKINALRPQMSPNDDLDYTYNITSNPRKELMSILKDSDKLSKNASADQENRTSPESGAAKGAILSTLPLVAAPVATYLTVRAIQEGHAKRLRKKMLSERVAIRNMQDKVDHEILQEQGLIKGANMSESKAEAIWKRHGKDKDEESLFNLALSVPVAATLGLSTIGGILAYNKLSDSDKYKNRLKYMRDHILGANTLQESPRISLAKYKTDAMVARPGDSTPVVIEETSSSVSDADKLRERTGLEEVTDTDVAPTKKSDALF
jgi:hypothetical protein